MTQMRATSLSAEDGRPSHLAHHFDSPRQQFEAAKLGMWMFLATEMLLFGGLFCAYAVFRANHPEIFAYGSQFLDTTWGAINTVVLILSSATMAIAVWCAQCDRRTELTLFLGFTLCFAADFLGIKYIEYSHKFHDNLVWGLGFYEPSRTRPVGPEAEAAVLEPGDAGSGRDLYLRTCLSCHGPNGGGLPGLGKPLRTSAFVSGLDDRGLWQFLKTGRSRTDPLNTTGLAMLPRGGNPRLTDQDLMHIVAFIRLLQERAGEDADVTARSMTVLPRSVIADAAEGPPGLVELDDELHPIDQPKTEAPGDLRATRPANAHVFFGIYFCMTGLHGLHVVAGMIVISWLLVRSLLGHFNSEYFTPVDLGGLYWHVVDLIWIFLFPLLYLIH